MASVTSTDEKLFKSTLDNVDFIVDGATRSSGELEDDVRQVLRENDRFESVDFDRLQEELSTGERGRTRERKPGESVEQCDSALPNHTAVDDHLSPYLVTPEDPEYKSSVHPLYKTVVAPPGALGLVIGRVTRQKIFEGYDSGDDVSSATPWDDIPGVYVFSVQVNSPLTGAGIGEGDRIVDINGVSVVGLTTREVTKVLRNTSDRERIVGFLEPWKGQGRELEEKKEGEYEGNVKEDELSTIGSM
jgi:hypothetical protein